MVDLPPWETGTSLLELVRAGSNDPESVELPAEGKASLAADWFGSGELDAILTHHGGDFAGLLQARDQRFRRLARARERLAPALFMELERLAEDDTDAARLGVYRAAQDGRLLASVAEVLTAFRAEPELRSAVVPHARWLIDEARHRGPVKLGLALLGAFGDGDDSADVERVRVLARHPDFGLYGVIALTNLLDDPVDELWAHAQATRGWRRIHSVERLAPLVAERSDIQDWLLREGWQHVTLDEYLAHPCATGGDLAGALEGEVDDELLDAAGSIITALIPGGPRVKTMRDYQDAPRTAAAWLAHLQTRCNSLDRLEKTLRLRAFLWDADPELGPGERWPNHDALIAACDRIALDPRWTTEAEAAFNDGTRRGEALGWRLAQHLGLDWWDVLFERLSSDPEGDRPTRIRRLVRAAQSDERRARLIAWAEVTLPLERLADDSAGHGSRAGDLKAESAALQALLRTDPAWIAHVGPSLLIAALRFPDRTSRILAARVLKAKPHNTWGPGVDEAVRYALTNEQGARVLEELRTLPTRA